MTIGEFKKIIKKFDIPEDVTLLSDSGWECSETDMDGVWYNKEEKQIIFTQVGDEYDRYFDKSEWVLLHSGKARDKCIL